MAGLYDNTALTERVILVGVSLQENDDTQESLDELEELAATAGAVTVGRLVQNREKIHPGTYLGKGKIEELKAYIWEVEATGIICDDELSPAQMANLADALDVKVMDRTLLILDIFAARAVSSEGKIQVELAQLRYRATRLTGLGTAMSRLGGGIGTRGPGEKKLEMDRRLIRSRISQFKKELEGVERHRETNRSQRRKTGIPVAAIVGYTNAGKSTLLNRLTGSNVLEEDKLFATLDATTRELILDGGQKILLTDTVGFIRKLPHHLVEAFKSTLEEARYADIILHVVDSASPQRDTHMYVVYDTLRQLNVGDKPVITLFNKTDLLTEKEQQIRLNDFRADRSVSISARSGEGMEELKAALEQILRQRQLLIERVFDYSRAKDVAVLRKYGQVLEEAYREDGIYVKAYVPKEVYARLDF